MDPTRRRLVSLTAALALIAGVAGPAAANAVGVVLAGTAIVGKNASFCNHDGTSDVSGAGLGFPGMAEPKQAFYVLRNVTVTVLNDVTKGVKAGTSTGVLNACGRLRWIGKISDGTAVGAACGLHKGYHGKGRIIYIDGPKAAAGFPHNTYSLHNIAWKADVVSTIAFWASGSQGVLDKGASGTDLVTGTVHAEASGSDCFGKAIDPNTGRLRSKDSEDSSRGATQFWVTGGFEVLNGMWTTDPQDLGQGTFEPPGICKDTDNPLCAYDTKKPQTPKQG